MPTIPRFVRETAAGEICDVADPRDIARAIQAAYANRCAYRRAAREAAHTYNWETEKQKMLSLYDQMLGGRSC